MKIFFRFFLSVFCTALFTGTATVGIVRFLAYLANYSLVDSGAGLLGGACCIALVGGTAGAICQGYVEENR